MPTQDDLLDILTRNTGCGYLSELHHLPPESPWRPALFDSVERLSADGFSESEWAEALRYITGRTPTPHAPVSALREALLHALV